MRPDLTDVQNVKAITKARSLPPSKRLGQHFLVDAKIRDAIIAAARIRSDDVVLEIGPGLGVLTQKMIKKTNKLIVVEQDKKLIPYLRETFGPSISVIQSDILALSNNQIADYSKSKSNVSDGSYRIVSNIPYNITGAIIKKFVSNTGPKPKDMLILVQKEVAERVCAKPGKLSLLGLSVQIFAEPKIMFSVLRESFWPVPKVDSCLLKIGSISEDTRYRIRDFDHFWRIIRIGFSAPRKQLQNNLSSGLFLNRKQVSMAMDLAGISEKSRAQELSITHWIRLSDALHSTT